MINFNREYDFLENEYYFKVDKSLKIQYELDDIEEFIIKSEMESIGTIKVEMQKKFDINNLNLYFIIWDKLHKLYTEDIVIWQGKNPFEDMYEYKRGKINFKIDVSLNTNYKKYHKGVFSSLAKDINCYELDINKVNKKPRTNLIFLSIYNNEDEVLGVISLLLGVNSNTYIIGNVYFSDEINVEIINNALLWVGSRLCLIFGQICKTFEFRINEEDLKKSEIKKLFASGFILKKISHFGTEMILLTKNI